MRGVTPTDVMRDGDIVFAQKIGDVTEPIGPDPLRRDFFAQDLFQEIGVWELLCRCLLQQRFEPLALLLRLLMLL